MSLEIDGEAKAYPLAILMWHEIVNDELGGIPVTVTFCPLCNTAIVFDRRLDGEVFDFGTSGLLRNSDLVMWDRQTESWWQQITGEAIVGELTGTKLTFIPANVISWGDFREIHPQGQVLTRETGFIRNYASPPYRGYDEIGSTPFLFSGEIDDRLDAMERVVGLAIDGQNMAYPFILLEANPVINDTVGGQELVVFYTGGTLSLDAMERVVGLAIDGQNMAYPFILLEANPVINDTVGGQELVVFYTGGTLSAFAGRGVPNRVVGSTGMYVPFVEGQKLTFKIQDALIVDEETGSKWNILGQAVEGPLEGS